MKSFVVGMAIVGAAGAANAQSSKLYVTDGDSNFIKTIQNGSVVDTNNNTGGSRLYRIAVNDSIWLGDMDFGTNVELDFNLNPTGNTSPSGVDIAEGTDGATDGLFNYTVESFVSFANVYRYNSDWSGGTSMFSVSGDQIVGITYDMLAGTFWISDVDTIGQYDMNGNLISSFQHSADRGSLAYEPATDTLWYVTNSGGSTIRQYSKTGSLLQTLTPNFGGNVWGAEFAIPAPGSATLIALGGVLAARRRRD